MAFPVNEKLPRTYLSDIINSNIMMVKTYVDDLDTPIVFSPYCRSVTASFRFYPITTNDATPLLYFTFSNLGDLNDLLYQSWIQLLYLTKGDLIMNIFYNGYIMCNSIPYYYLIFIYVSCTYNLMYFVQI